MAAHDELLARHRAVTPQWLALYYQHPIALVSGRGRHVTDAEGRRYLDFFGGIVTTMVGHAVEEITDAIAEQAARLIHSSTLYLSEPLIELSEAIAARSGIADARVFLTTSGSEANEAALLLCSAHRGSNQVLALRNSYHGRSFATMGVTGNRGWTASTLSPFSVCWAASGYRLRSPLRHGAPPGPEGDAAFTDACVEDLRQLMATETAGRLACMIAEPIQSVGGVAVPPEGFLGAYQRELAADGTPVVCDEVQTGWGRTGDAEWGHVSQDLQPDLLTFAKGVGNGVPLAGVVGRAEILDAVDADSISTFGGGPLVAAAGLATLRYVDDHGLQANAAAMGERIRAALDPLATTHPGVAEVRGTGLLIGIELTEDDGWTPSRARAGAVMERCRAEGLLIGRCGLDGNCLRLAPALSVTAEEVDEACEILVAAVVDVLEGAPPLV